MSLYSLSRTSSASSCASIEDTEYTELHHGIEYYSENEEIKRNERRIDIEVIDRVNPYHLGDKFELDEEDLFKFKLMGSLDVYNSLKHSNGSICLDIEANDVESIVRVLVLKLVDDERIDNLMDEDCISAVLRSQFDFPKALGNSFDLYVAFVPGLSTPSQPLPSNQPVIALGRLATPLNLDAPDGVPTRFLGLILWPSNDSFDSFQQDPFLHYALGFTFMMDEEEFHCDFWDAKTEEDVFNAIHAFLKRMSRIQGPDSVHHVLEHIHQEDEDKAIDSPLQFLGRGRGIFSDMKRRYSHYLSDIKDGLAFSSILVILLLFFACMAPAIAFGGMMDKLTDGNIGEIEMLLSTGICMSLFSLFAAQPLVILGGTGPLLVYIGVLFELTDAFDLKSDFLQVYTLVGLWSSFFIILLALTEASCLIHYITRYSDEILSLLISLIFILQVVKDLVSLFPDSESGVPLLSLNLALGTFGFTLFLKRVRKSRYLHPRIREFLSDFSTLFAILIFTGLDFIFEKVEDTRSEKLGVPDVFGPTLSGRGWFIPFWETDIWVIFLTSIPGFLLTLLIFLDQNLAEKLINKPDNKLKKGYGYHLDLFVIGILIGLCSLVGLPWIVAATVRSIIHLHALATKEEYVTKEGIVHTHIIHVQENRITGLVVGLLICLSIFTLPLLSQIPMPVLYGIFLYMGVSILSGSQLWARVKLLFMQPSLYPPAHYVRKLRLHTIHFYTLTQLGWLGALIIIKQSKIAIIFPLVNALLVPFRLFVLPRFFQKNSLEFLDAEEEPDEQEVLDLADH